MNKHDTWFNVTFSLCSSRCISMKHLHCKVLPSQSEWRARHFSWQSAEMHLWFFTQVPIQSLAMWRTPWKVCHVGISVHFAMVHRQRRKQFISRVEHGMWALSKCLKTCGVYVNITNKSRATLECAGQMGLRTTLSLLEGRRSMNRREG